MFIKHPQLTAVEKKTLFLSSPYLAVISLQTRTKLRKSAKGLLNFCKLQIVFKSQRKPWNVFHFRYCLSFDFVSRVEYKYTCVRCTSIYYCDTDGHLKVRSGEWDITFDVWGLLAQFSTKPTFYSDIFTTYLQLLCPAQSTLVLKQRILAIYFRFIFNCCVSHIGRLK